MNRGTAAAEKWCGEKLMQERHAWTRSLRRTDYSRSTQHGVHEWEEKRWTEANVKGARSNTYSRVGRQCIS